MMPSVLSNEALHFLHQDNQNEEQHDFFGHMTPLPLALHNATGVIIT